MRRLREDRGFTLVELMVSALLSLVILSATLLVIDAMWRNDRRAELVNDQQQSVRISLDRMARQLRNLASPTTVTAISGTLPRSVERNDRNDLVFRDVADAKPGGSANSANARRVRYCLDTSSDPNNVKLLMQMQTWTTPDPSTPEPPVTPCNLNAPQPGWNGGTQVVAQHLTNSSSRPVFTYSGDSGLITAVDSDARADIDRIGAQLFLRLNVKNPPPETELMTSVFLRNQNREPQAKFSLTVLNQSTRTILLNGSASQDPEGRPLEYVWNIDGVDQTTKGIVVQLVLPEKTPNAPDQYTIYLKAKDPAGLQGDSLTQKVTL